MDTNETPKVTIEQYIAKASEPMASPTDVIASVIGYDHPALDSFTDAYYEYSSEGHSDADVVTFLNAMFESA